MPNNKLINQNIYANPLIQEDFIDHFYEINNVTTTGKWKSVSTGTAPSLLADGTSSSIVLTADATVNHEDQVVTNNKWIVVANRPIETEARVKNPGAVAANMASFIGFHSAGQTAAVITATTLNTLAAGSTVGFLKGITVENILVNCAVASTNYGLNTSDTVVTTTSGFYSYRTRIQPISSTVAEVAYFIDTAGGNNFRQLRDSTTNALIKHKLTYTSYAAAYFLFAEKVLSSAETMTVDYVRISQRL